MKIESACCAYVNYMPDMCTVILHCTHCNSNEKKHTLLSLILVGMFLRNGILLVANECVFVGERGRERELLHSHTICRCTDLFTFELPFSFGKLLRCKVRLKTAHMHFGFLSVYCFTQCALSHYFTQLFVLRCCAFVSFFNSFFYSFFSL